MIVRQFISWVRNAPAGERAEATRCLARAWLVSDLSEDDRAAAEGALLMLLDDASPLVRQAMAETFAHSADAPPAIIAALASDQASVAMPILEHSPLLIDSDLVDIVATGTCDMQCAIARRRDLPASVSAAVAEVGSPASALELIENPHAALASFSLARIAERHGHLAAIRESLLALDHLPAAIRLMLAEKLSGTLTQFVAARAWMKEERVQRAASEALERSTINIVAQTHGADLVALVQHLRATGQLNAGLILRALLSGNGELFEEALVELSGLSRARVAAIVHDRSSASVTALLTKAGLPNSTFAAFRASLEAINEVGFVGTVAGAARLRRRMVERVLTRCETSPDVSEPLLILLRRFATESAREEARLYCDELAADDFVQALTAQAVAEVSAYDEGFHDDAQYDEASYDDDDFEDDVVDVEAMSTDDLSYSEDESDFVHSDDVHEEPRDLAADLMRTFDAPVLATDVDDGRGYEDDGASADDWTYEEWSRAYHAGDPRAYGEHRIAA